MTTGRKCQVCGLQLKADDTFCGACRTTFCPRCKRAVDADGGLFCAVCGASLRSTRKTEGQKRAEERAKNWSVGAYDGVCEPSEFAPEDDYDANFLIWRKAATLDGRGSWSEFWFYGGFELAAVAVASYFCDVSTGYVVAATVLALVAAIPTPAAAVRRLHDVGLSGGWLALAALPVVGWAVLAVMLLLPGDERPNRYGNPTRYFRRKRFWYAFVGDNSFWRKGTDDYFDARLLNDGKVYDGRLGVWRSRAAVAEEKAKRR